MNTVRVSQFLQNFYIVKMMSQMPWCQVWRMSYGGCRSVPCSASTLVLWSWKTKIVFSRPGNVLTVKTTYYNFGAAIWSNQLMGTPRTGHLVDGLKMDWCYVIFTMICFQKYFIDLCILSYCFGSLGAGIIRFFVYYLVLFLSFFL